MRKPHPASYLLLAALLLPVLSAAKAPPAETTTPQPELLPAAPQTGVAGEALRPLLPNPERSALTAIQEEGRLRVRALAKRIRLLPDGPERRELAQQVTALKHEYRIRFLETRIGFAQARGDTSSARRIQDVIDRLMNPRMSVTPPVSKKPVPAASEKGGRR